MTPSCKYTYQNVGSFLDSIDANTVPKTRFEHKSTHVKPGILLAYNYKCDYRKLIGVATDKEVIVGQDIEIKTQGRDVSLVGAPREYDQLLIAIGRGSDVYLIYVIRSSLSTNTYPWIYIPTFAHEHHFYDLKLNIDLYKIFGIPEPFLLGVNSLDTFADMMA